MSCVEFIDLLSLLYGVRFNQRSKAFAVPMPSSHCNVRLVWLAQLPLWSGSRRRVSVRISGGLGRYESDVASAVGLRLGAGHGTRHDSCIR